MKPCVSTLSIPFLGLLAACATGSEAQQPDSAPVAAGSQGAPAPAAAAGAQGFEKIGIVAPSDYAPVSLWPEKHAGGWTVLEVLPHGTTVAVGDVIARLDARAIDEELHRLELEVESSELAHRAVLRRNQLDGSAAKLALEHSTAALERAERSLQGYEALELAFVKRQDELQKRYEESSVEDQLDELGQLEKMYQEDALVDATEDIVVKRSRRQLEMTRTSNQLSRDRSKYREEYDLAMSLAQRRETLAEQREAHARLSAQQELDALARADGEVRSADGVRLAQEKLDELRRDRALFELRAPRAGVLLHGGSKCFRAGGGPVRHEKGSQLGVQSELFLVAAPGPAAVCLALTDAELASLPDGTPVEVQALAPGGAKGTGEIRIETYPRSASASESSYEATVMLDAPLADTVYGSRARVTVAGAKGRE